MKRFLALSICLLSGAAVAGACTASDGDSDPDKSPAAGGSGGKGAGGGSSSSSGGNGGGTSSSGGSGGSASGGSAGSYGDGGMAGEMGMAGEGGMAGAPAEACIGDAEIHDLPDCDELSYNQVECSGFTPPEPLGVSYCRLYAEHGTPEAFQVLFECLDQIDESDDCSEDHDDAARACRDQMVEQTCPNAAVDARCANLGCDEISAELCSDLLSSLTPSGGDHVVSCINEHTGDEPGGSWGAPPEPPEEGTCGDIFMFCMSGTLTPSG